MCTTRSAMPDLYGVLIDMFLSPGTISNSARLFAGQGFLQVVLLLSALVSVPLMLLVKPFVLRKRHQQRTQVCCPLCAAHIAA
jgi:V-type H+-transporting ATPase subunit a